MKQLKAILIFFAICLVPATAQLRFALVDCQKIYEEFPTAQKLKERIQTSKLEIAKSPLALKIEEEQKLLSSMAEQLKDQTLTDKQQKLEIAKQFKIKEQAYQSLVKEFENYKNKRISEINQDAVVKIRANLKVIQKQAAATARELGYDALLDYAGSTNTGVPFVLYAKKDKDGKLPNDITSQVSAALKDAGTITAPAPQQNAAP